jgi:hypothetical protein
MKRNLLVIVVCFISTSFLAAQQIENASFEEWEDAGTVQEEPVNWSSLKTTDNTLVNSKAPVVWQRSDDAHTGLSSVKLLNTETLGIIATGLVTNGRVHGTFVTTEGYVYTVPEDEKWHTSFTYRPDSLVGWFKFYPQPGDSCVVTCVVHVGEGTLPEGDTQENMVGKAEFKSNGETVEEWTRFSVPFNYYNSNNPEYILITLNGGNKLNSTADSYALYDDLELIYNNSSIDETAIETDAIYVYDKVIHLEKLDDNELKGAVLNVFNLNGQKIVETEVTSSNISIGENIVYDGIYVIMLNTAKNIYTRKVYIH